MIKSTRINGVVVDDSMLLRAIEELAAAHGKSVREEHALILSRVDDCNSAASWSSAIAQVATEQAAGSDALVDEYVKAYPPYDKDGQRLALTDTDDTTKLTSEGALAEITRLVQEDGSRRKPVLDASRPSAQVPCRTVQLSRQASSRMYDDTLALTSTVGDDRRAMDAYLIKLSRGGPAGAKALGDLTALAGGQTREDVLDSGAPSESDLGGQVSMPPQTDSFGQLSQRASDQLSGLAPVYQQMIKAALDAADAEEDPSASDGFRSTAAGIAHRQGARVLAQELAQRGGQARLGESTLTDPDDADAQSAGETSAANVASEVERLSSLAMADTSGNRSNSPLSAAAQAAGRAVAHPGR